MMVLAFKMSSEVFDNPLPKLLFSTALLSCIHLKGVEITIIAVCKHPHLYASLDGFHRHVLFHCRLTSKLDHCLMHHCRLVWLVEVGKLLGEVICLWSHLT